jgi:catechol 2,3-dioxygenase-like lactoylglutathione lyase family enzyme
MSEVEPHFRPRLNHVAMSMPTASLDDAARAEILDFYGEVFGWALGDNTGEEGNPLIMYTGAFGEFVYLLPADPPLTAPPLDHFGLLVATLDEHAGIVARAKARAATDDRVRVIDTHARTTAGPEADYTLTSAYVGFLLPLMVEIQHLARHDHAEASATQT